MKEMNNNLKKYRVWKGLTRKELSIILKVSNSLLVIIENDGWLPKCPIRKRICDFFDVSPTQMFPENKEVDEK
jgi:DNA-binding XRE family transcriptional regulator